MSFNPGQFLKIDCRQVFAFEQKCPLTGLRQRGPRTHQPTNGSLRLGGPSQLPRSMSSGRGSGRVTAYLTELFSDGVV